MASASEQYMSHPYSLRPFDQKVNPFESSCTSVKRSQNKTFGLSALAEKSAKEDS